MIRELANFTISARVGCHYQGFFVFFYFYASYFLLFVSTFLEQHRLNLGAGSSTALENILSVKDCR